MDREQKITLRVIYPEQPLSSKTKDESAGHDPPSAREQLKELALHVAKQEWILLYRLVQKKKGSMDGDAVEDYLKNFFEVSDLSLLTPQRVQEAVQFLARMPDRIRRTM